LAASERALPATLATAPSITAITIPSAIVRTD
jgi:hypothetical protein